MRSEIGRPIDSVRDVQQELEGGGVAEGALGQKESVVQVTPNQGC